jgi:hypothetical protein
MAVKNVPIVPIVPWRLAVFDDQERQKARETGIGGIRAPTARTKLSAVGWTQMAEVSGLLGTPFLDTP